MMRPVKRSRLRICIGKCYYTVRRYISWIIEYRLFANRKDYVDMPYNVYEHSTPIYRELVGVNLELLKNKEKNLRIAIKNLDGVVIEPGQKFSYWRLIGKPSIRKGYLPGMVLFYGNLTSGTGGGLCQLSNLIYWISLYTPLKVVERYRHSYDVFPDSNRTQPFGSGATCVYPYRDLQLYNDTDNCFQLRLKIMNGRLYGMINSDKPLLISYMVYQKEHCITHELWGGYVRHNRIFRKEFDVNGRQLDDYEVTQNHAVMMYEPFLEKHYD
ncbi:MAG TPA: VanW family protein [Spirochaetota bacterium]|nr:VanW family protein [Spirochaetota bacterium]